LRLELQLSKDICVAGEVEITEITDVPYDMKLIAEIENLNKKTFKLIQII